MEGLYTEGHSDIDSPVLNSQINLPSSGSMARTRQWLVPQ